MREDLQLDLEILWHWRHLFLCVGFKTHTHTHKYIYIYRRAFILLHARCLPEKVYENIKKLILARHVARIRNPSTLGGQGGRIMRLEDQDHPG